MTKYSDTTDHAMEAVLTIQLPIDSNGEAFYMYKTPTEDSANIEFYVCSCGEQFGQFNDAQAHLNKEI